MGAAITGWGVALPDKTVTNADLEARLDTTDAWIVERTGIHERRIGGTHRRARRRGRAARPWPRAGPRAGDDIDLLVLATTTPDQPVPATSATVSRQARAAAAGRWTSTPPAPASSTGSSPPTACSASAVGAAHAARRRRDALSRITDWEDRDTAILFADGAGAAVVEAVGRAGPAARLGPRLRRHRRAPPLRRPRRLHPDGGPRGLPAGRRGRWSTRRSARWRRPASTPDDVDLVVPHQANIRIIEAAIPAARHPDREDGHRPPPHRQHVVGHDPDSPSCDAIEHGRVHDGDDRAARRLRRRHDLGRRRAALGRGPPGEPLNGGRAATRPDRAGHGRQPGHRPGLRPHASPPQGHRVAVTYRSAPPPDADDLLARAVRRHRRRAGRRRLRHGRGHARPGRGARLQRRHQPRQARAAHERGRLHLGARRQPHRRLPGGQAGGRRR